MLLRRRLTMAVLVTFLLLLAAAPTLAESTSVDWNQMVRDLERKRDLTIREQVYLVMAYGNTGGITRLLGLVGDLDKQDWIPTAHEMMEESEEALEEDPGNLIHLNTIAFASFALNDYETSGELFEQIVELDPENHWPRLYLGWSWGSTGRVDDGIEQIEIVAKEEPWNFSVRMLLIWAKAQRALLR